MYTLSSETTRMGNRSHVVQTTAPAFAHALFEQALDVDIEPDFEKKQGTYTIGFICDDNECAAAIESARRAS